MKLQLFRSFVRLWKKRFDLNSKMKRQKIVPHIFWFFSLVLKVSYLNTVDQGCERSVQHWIIRQKKQKWLFHFRFFWLITEVLLIEHRWSRLWESRSAPNIKTKLEEIVFYIFSSFDLILKELAFEHRLS